MMDLRLFDEKLYKKYRKANKLNLKNKESLKGLEAIVLAVYIPPHAPCNIWGRNYNSIRDFIIWFRIKIIVFIPKLIPL